MTTNNEIWQLAEIFDTLQGLDAQVMHRRFLGEHSHEQIADDLGIGVEESILIASRGLRLVKDRLFTK